jgi:hypothetical protein
MNYLMLQNISQSLHATITNATLISEYLRNYKLEHKENK